MGGQTHPTLVFSVLDEMLDAFDQGLTCCHQHNHTWLLALLWLLAKREIIIIIVIIIDLFKVGIHINIAMIQELIQAYYLKKLVKKKLNTG